MSEYKLNKYELVDINIDKYLNDFLHLIDAHSTDDEFETIYNAFGGVCDLQKCDAFKRNRRDRQSVNNSVNIAVNIQILDKIHCHYSHCFDIGYKLNKKERQEIESKIENDNDEYLVNNRLLEIHKILSPKHSLYGRIC